MSATDAAEHAAHNKQLVRAFYELVFVEHRPREAAARYLGPNYVQHHPGMRDGPQAFIDFCEGYFAKFPAVRPWIRRMVAEGDLVCLHSESRRGPDDRGRAIMDIFRVEDGRIVEHWDVMQELPEHDTNPHGMV